MAELTEMSAGLQGGIGVCEGTLERVHERLEEQREMAAGRARVAQEGIDVSALEEDEEERAALAEEALRRFESQREGEGATPPDDAEPR